MKDLEREGWNLKTMGELDHRLVKSPYIRMIGYKEGVNGDFIYTYDLRFTQPNKKYMDPKVLHSLEHLLLFGFRKYMDSYISVSPMGCQTGFYLILLNECNADNIVANFEKILNDILIADSVPFANETDCGQAAYHDLDGAKKIVKRVLEEKNNWLTVY